MEEITRSKPQKASRWSPLPRYLWSSLRISGLRPGLTRRFQLPSKPIYNGNIDVQMMTSLETHVQQLRKTDQMLQMRETTRNNSLPIPGPANLLKLQRTASLFRQEVLPPPQAEWKNAHQPPAVVPPQIRPPSTVQRSAIRRSLLQHSRPEAHTTTAVACSERPTSWILWHQRH